MLLRASASLLLLAGCIAAPKEVETTIDLGPQKVEIEVKVKDVRAIGGDDLRQLETFAQFAKWDAEWTKDMTWAPSPSKFVYSADAGRLDLALHGTMARADFDRCARADGGCEAFPMVLTKAGYAVHPDVLGLHSIAFDPKQKLSWPVDAGRIVATVALTGDPDVFVRDGPSLLRGFTLFQQDPVKAAATVKEIEDASSKRASGTDWAVPDTCTDIPWCGLKREALDRDRVRLVYRYLSTRTEGGGYGLRSPPPQTIDYLGSVFTNLAPRENFPMADELKLRITYDLARDAFRETGAARGEWKRVCRPDTMKKPALKEFCGRLLP